MKIVQVKITGFDSLENENPEYTQELKYFMEDSEALRLYIQQESERPKYSGYYNPDTKEYPKIEVQSIEVQE